MITKQQTCILLSRPLIFSFRCVQVQADASVLVIKILKLLLINDCPSYCSYYAQPYMCPVSRRGKDALPVCFWVKKMNISSWNTILPPPKSIPSSRILMYPSLLESATWSHYVSEISKSRVLVAICL